MGYAIERHRDQTVLLGRVEIRLAVRDENGARHVTGVLRDAPWAGDVNLVVSADRIVGHVQTLNVDLEADGDTYRGAYRIGGDPHAGEMSIDGRQAILQLPRAELGALLPPMLKCNRRGGFAGPYADPPTREPVEIGFGGPPRYQTLANGHW